MNRVNWGGFTELVSAALELLPAGARSRLGEFGLVAGYDPVFIGAAAPGSDELTFDGRSYRQEWHVMYPMHQVHLRAAERVTTLVMPTFDLFKRRNPDWCLHGLIHEFGHILHERLGLEYFPVVPVDEYAASNYVEAFASSFAEWVLPGFAAARWERYENATVWFGRDVRTRALFEQVFG